MEIKVPKYIQTIIDNNLKVDREVVDGYILYANKHGKTSGLDYKYEQLKKYFNKCCSEAMPEYDCYKNQYFIGEEKRVKIRIRLQGNYKTILTDVNG